MGILSRNIAIIGEPKIVSLSGVPNFFTVASLPPSSPEGAPPVRSRFEALLTVTVPRGGGDETWTNKTTLLEIRDPNGGLHSFKGTMSSDLVDANTFWVSSYSADTAQNLRAVLLNDAYIRANFDITIPFTWYNGALRNGSVLNIVSKGYGSAFNITISAPNNIDNAAYILNVTSPTSRAYDSLIGEAPDGQIDLDVYVDAPIFLGEDDRAISTEKLGSYLTTLNKTYAQQPIWFNLAGVLDHSIGHKTPSVGSFGWFPTSTYRNMRFIAKTVSYNTVPFYQSSLLFVLLGYNQLSEALDMEQYVYEEGKIVKLLTTKPRTSYVKGQSAYLNFILRDPLHNTDAARSAKMSIVYRLFTQSGEYIDAVFDHEVSRASLDVVNTCSLDISKLLDEYPKTGIVRVSLAHEGTIVSDDLVFDIQPECLHVLNQVHFINRFGGWECFNFDAYLKNETKQTNGVFSKTVTPEFKRGDSLETVFDKTVGVSYSMESAPVSDDVIEWLKELAASRVVLDDDGDYIIIDDMTIPRSDDKPNAQTATLKYHLSDTFNNN